MSLRHRLFGRGTMPSHRLSSRPSVRPQLERLESRFAPATFRVGPNDAIQAAINRAYSGDTIEVLGKHKEQIVIANDAGHSRDDLKIVGANERAIIAAPASMTSTNAIVEIRGAQNVTIKYLTISGPTTSSGDTFYGILIDNGGSAKISKNHVTAIADRPLNGLQRGVAIQIGSAVPGISAGTATITDNLIDRYQKNGIQVSGAGSSARIEDNAILGAGPTNLIAQNGIQISAGATAQICDNCISGNVYKPEPFAATGILLLSPGAVTIHDNALTKNDVGIFVFRSTAPIVIDDNIASGNVLIGILLDTTSGARVTDNTTNKNGSGHAAVDGGIALFNSTGNRIENNVSQNNKGAGIYVHSDSTGNTFSQNLLKGNALFDGEDHSTGSGTAKTGNTWKNNFGKTSNRAGLLKPFRDDRGSCDDREGE